MDLKTSLLFDLETGFKFAYHGQIYPIKNNRIHTGTGASIKNADATKSIVDIRSAIEDTLHLNDHWPIAKGVLFGVVVDAYIPNWISPDRNNVMNTILDAAQGVLYPDDRYSVVDAIVTHPSWDRKSTYFTIGFFKMNEEYLKLWA